MESHKNYIIQSKAAEEMGFKIDTYKRLAMARGVSEEEINEVISNMFTLHKSYDLLLIKINDLLDGQKEKEI